jgi:hypothetical protein
MYAIRLHSPVVVVLRVLGARRYLMFSTRLPQDATGLHFTTELNRLSDKRCSN